MQKQLGKNICGLDDYAILNKVKDLPNHQKECIGGLLEYSCCFWTKHLVKTPSSGPDVKGIQKAIDKFITICLLFWIEALSHIAHTQIAPCFTISSTPTDT